MLECDDLINAVCEKHNGVIRQVNGDQYFITFSEYGNTISALWEMFENWAQIIEHFGIGVSIGIHKGDLNVIRSYA